jgi:hypothetical protein
MVLDVGWSGVAAAVSSCDPMKGGSESGTVLCSCTACSVSQDMCRHTVGRLPNQNHVSVKVDPVRNAEYVAPKRHCSLYRVVLFRHGHASAQC